MEQLAHNCRQCCYCVQTFFEQLPLPCRSKFWPRKCRPRCHAPVSSFYLLDYDRRIAELGLEHEPPAFQIVGQRLTFKRGRWTSQSCHGLFPSSQTDLLKNAREENRILQDQNNVLQVKLEVVMDMLTETTANLLLLEEEEEETEGKDEEKKEEEEEELVEVENQMCPKKPPKQTCQYDVDSSDFEYGEDLLVPVQWNYKYPKSLTSFEEESEYSEELNLTRYPQGKAKPKICPLKRAARAKDRARLSMRQGSRVKYSVPPKTKSSPKVCKLELEPEPMRKTYPKRRAESRPKPKPRSVKQTDGVCPMK
ncbi:hypothetical protein scyTo_0015858 [Scyliorhinus torazame]|uniref:Uncharacterized protein n=1 Tax=Scyliorhinus torazame TaxID=75743 RepID=A0A401PZT2_SCYTO|nr:hypothetical protein [Scyliorhinus torazame]